MYIYIYIHMQLYTYHRAHTAVSMFCVGLLYFVGSKQFSPAACFSVVLEPSPNSLSSDETSRGSET